VVAAVALALVGCAASTGPPPPATGSGPQPSSGSTAPAPSSPATPPAHVGLPTYGGAGVPWPDVAPDGPAPVAYGALVTTRHVETTTGTLAPGLVLPRLDASRDAPIVVAPCDDVTRLTGGGWRFVPPAATGHPLVVLDPGHGGHADGAVAADGTREADLTLDLARRVRRALPAGIRVVLTRDRDMDAGLGYRVAIADRLRADLAVSLHFDATPTPTYGRIPGVQVYGALDNSHGRRAAGVLYQAERRFLATQTAAVDGRWTHGPDRGALYRRGTDGRDYYYLLRESHVPWVISEPLFLSTPREARLAEQARFREGLARAVAAGIVDYLDGARGSGWRRPTTRPPDPPPPGGSGTCTTPR
jgi:N-acetylmuramoyl-L-alanine amidase